MKFLLENPFLIIVLLGFLSSLFSKKNEKQEKQKQPQKQRNKPFEMQKSPKKQKNNPFDMQKPFVFSEKTEPKKVILPKKKQQQNEAARYEQMKADAIAEMEYLKEQQAQIEAKAKKIRNIQVQAAENSPTDKPFNENKLIDAVIWSEIIGPPRAKRPHKVVNGNRYKRYS